MTERVSSVPNAANKVLAEHIRSCEERQELEDHVGCPMERTSCGCECHE